MPIIEQVPELEVTQRDLEILTLVKAGYSNIEMTKILFISESTIKTHLSRLYLDFNVHSRYELIIYLWKYGIPNIRRKG